MTVKIIQDDCERGMQGLEVQSVQCCITSPPYWGLRDYGFKGQLGLEKTPEEYIEKMVNVFREVWRVLRDDGTLWLNCGDSYWGGKGQSGQQSSEYQAARQDVSINKPYHQIAGPKTTRPSDGKHDIIKPKDLIGMPWRLAFALQADGWYLRSACPWVKRSAMPESVTDRPSSALEYIFLLTKQPKYYYDADAVRVECSSVSQERYKYPMNVGIKETSGGGRIDNASNTPGMKNYTGYRNRRNSDWWFESVGMLMAGEEIVGFDVNPQGFKEAHFATFPPKLIEPMVKAGTKEGDTILDPFGGAGTTGLVADRLGRDAILIELNEEYCKMARKRIKEDNPLFAKIE